MMYFEDIQIQLIDTPPLSRDHTEPWLFDIIRRSDMLLVVVDVQADPLQQLEDTISFLEEHRIAPFKLSDLHEDKAGWVFLPFLVVANKNDDHLMDENFEIFKSLLKDDWLLVNVSAKTSHNFDTLKQTLFNRLEIVRVYTKTPGKEPDLGTPFVLKKGSKIEDLAAKIHKDILEKFKSARVWGKNVYDGQMVQRDHILQDGDIVEVRV